MYTNRPTGVQREFCNGVAIWLCVITRCCVCGSHKDEDLCDGLTVLQLGEKRNLLIQVVFGDRRHCLINT